MNTRYKLFAKKTQMYEKILSKSFIKTFFCPIEIKKMKITMKPKNKILIL